jgi:hypothetical protein
MGSVYFGLPEPLVGFLCERFALTSLVETGTFHGGTAAWAAPRFREVYSIEVAEPLWHAARERHRSLTNVTFLLGDAPSQLRTLAPKLERPLFWLDAHWCGSGTGRTKTECPVLEELAAIAAGRDDDPFILIDDARLFLAPPPRPHDWRDWPDLETVIAALHACGDLWITVRDDVIVAVPSAHRAALVEFFQSVPPVPARPQKKAKPITVARALRHLGIGPG